VTVGLSRDGLPIVEVIEWENRQRTDPTRGAQETITSAGNGFDESGGCSTFSKGTANLPDAEIEAMLEVNERVLAPESTSKFFSRYQVSSPRDQMDEQSESLWAKSDAVIELPQFHCVDVESKRTKPYPRLGIFHRKSRGDYNHSYLLAVITSFAWETPQTERARSE
jgi:hypothetical protein